MKRYIDLGNQTGNIEEGEVEFAFYCTVSDTFEMFSGSQTWDSIEEFTEDYKNDAFKGNELDRFLKLIPKSN